MTDFDYDVAVADWPELTREQKDRLAVLLRPGIQATKPPSKPIDNEPHPKPPVPLRPLPRPLPPAPKPGGKQA